MLYSAFPDHPAVTCNEIHAHCQLNRLSGSDQSVTGCPDIEKESPLMKAMIRRIIPGPLMSLYRSLAGQRKDRIIKTEEDRLQRMVGPPGVWNESRDFQIDFLRRRGLQSNHSVLDLGCGPLRGGIPLIRFLDAGKYFGIDVRAEVVEEAKRQVCQHKLMQKTPTIVLSDEFGRRELCRWRFEYVWCFQLFYHLEDNLVDDCFRQISHVLAQQGQCYANVNLTLTEGTWKEFPYVQRSLQFYDSLADRHGLRLHDLGQQREWGYTTKVSGQYEHMLELRHKSI